MKLTSLRPETVEMIAREMESIPDKYQKAFNSTHEGYAVLLEEVRELEHVVFFGEKEAKNEINTQYPNPTTEKAKEELKTMMTVLHRNRLREEATQIAAMAARIIQELT